MEDIIRAKKKLVWNLTSNIGLNIPVHIGLYANLGLNYQNCVYPSIVRASEINGLCKHKIVYAVFSQHYQHEHMYVLSILDFDFLNKSNLIPISTEKNMLFIINNLKKRQHSYCL